MSDITELERRITAALDHIGQKIEAYSIPEPVAAPADVSDELAAEREANSQLTARNTELNEQLAAQTKSADAIENKFSERVSRLRQQVSDLDHTISKLRRINQQLRDNNDALRTANAEGSSEPHLINQSMMNEVESLRAAQSADQAEMETVRDELERILKEGTDA